MALNDILLLAFGVVTIVFVIRLLTVYFSKESKQLRIRLRTLREEGMLGSLDGPRGREEDGIPIYCHWCERTIERRLRPCTAICDHELDDLVSSHPDALCRQRLKELDYPIYRKGDNSDGPPS